MHPKAPAILPLAALLLLALTAPAEAADLEQKLRVSKQVFEQLMATPERANSRVVHEARCIAVIPNMVKGAIGFGGHKGLGVISCRRGETWSPPAFVKIGGGSFGLQIGGEISDVVLFFMTQRGVESLLETKFTIGGDAGVAAGPFGSGAETSTDLKFRAEIYASARSRGLFAGLSIEGAHMSISQKAIRSYYGERIWPEEILFEHQVPVVPDEAAAFMEVLPSS
ncbi:MAG: lipid-binding SYLF domain-containing protein [Thermoanaerobaculia bacterium]|nr:lipid-binding SYLF domain-containing protein [Thermoanaerobaculia bacterium]